jgi:hypothetical protein
MTIGRNVILSIFASLHSGEEQLHEKALGIIAAISGCDCT